MKTGLVLEGGAMRGMYTAGALDILMDAGICPDGIMSVSAGALFGVNFLSGQRGRAIRYNKRFNGDPNYLGLRPLLREGNIVSTEYAYHRVPHLLDPFDNAAYVRRAQDVPFYAVATALDTGEPNAFRITDVFAQMDVLRASGSMPFLSRPVMLNGRPYLDGGASDSIPYARMLAMGYDRLLVILTRDSSYVKRPMSAPLIRAVYGRHAAFARRLLTRHTAYNDSVRALSALEAQGLALVLRPSSPITVSRIERNPDRLQAVYDLGCADARARLDAIRRFMRGDSPSVL